jgi:hypothetical protein
MSDQFSTTGGARLDGLNWTASFATLSGNKDELRLSVPGREYVFPKNNDLRLSRYRGVFSVGLRIEHDDETVPQFVVFWAPVFFWTSGFRNLKIQLESLGYKVTI